jgi:hypothetical protein
MITTLESAVTDSFLKEYLLWKKNKKVSIFSVLIDSYANSSAVLNSFSDEVKKLSEMKENSGDEVMLTIVDGIL